MIKPLYYKTLKLKNRIIQGKPVLIFMYHRIHNSSSKELDLAVSLENFEQQLIYIKKNYSVLRLTDNWHVHKKAGAVITFDDGYADNFLNAMPLLEKYDMPATFFITTENIDTKKEFWWDHFAFDYNQCETDFYIPGVSEKVSKKEYSYPYLSGLLMAMKTSEKQRWIETFEDLNKIEFYDREDYRSMSQHELNQLASHPLAEIGIHTHHHYPLGCLSKSEQQEELLYSVEKLKQLSGKDANFLALPHGSYNEHTLNLVKEIGFRGMLLANNGYSNKANKFSGKMNRIFMPDKNGKALEKFLRKFEFNFGSFGDL